MKRVVVSLALVGLLVFGLSLTASAGGQVIPTVTAVEPASAFNDIDAPVTIRGADFAAGVDGTTTVSLQGTALTDVTWVDTQTLTATVPWGMNPGVYALTATNPGAEPTTLPGAFEVKPGIGTWNAGELNGASVAELLMKRGDPNTLYALAYDVGLFRSDDAGENWHFMSADVVGNADFVQDPNPGHESWLYSFMSAGLFVSKNEGDSWTQLSFDEPNPSKSPPSREVFVSPHDPNTLFVATYGNDTYVPDEGLKKSTDGGKTWTVVQSMVGTAVQNVAFDPTPAPAPQSHDMVLATADARVFRSTNDGATWVPVASPPVASIGFKGYLTYNPYYAEKPGEVWLSSTEMAGGVFKCAITDPVPSWTRAMPDGYTSGYKVTFLGPNDIYMWLAHSIDGGATWEPIGPSPTWGTGEYVFNPDDTHTIYFTNATVGVQKSTDGGTSWHDSNQGLTGMRCVSMSVSTTDPLRVYATFNGWGGVFVSDDGTSHWKYVPIAGSGQMWQILQDPFDKGLLYATGAGFYTSTDGAETWHDWGWTGIPDSLKGLMGFGGMAADPDPNYEGHLLVAGRVGQSSAHDHDLGYVFSSDDHGQNWTSVVVTGTAGSSSAVIGDIVFDPDPQHAGWVYLATGGNGIWKSMDHGRTWKRIDGPSDPSDQKWMANSYSISIATHPQRVLLVSGDSGRPFRSFDDGKTWELKQGSGEVSARKYVFVDGDSTRLYSPDWTGLHFSSNVGDSWTNAAGIIGSVQNTTLAYTEVDGHTLLYAATTGGKTGVVIASASGAGSRMSALAAPAPEGSLVGAGIYRRAQVETSATFTSTGSRDGWVLESSHTSNHGGSASSGSSTLRLGDNASKKQYRSVLSFTTSGLPDDAVITGVTLRVRRQGVTGGGNPVTTFHGFMADVKHGYFGSSTKLQASDFQASTTKSYGPWTTALLGSWYSLDLTGGAAYINKSSAHSGLTQIRLRFKLDDNGNRKANYLSLYSGNASSTSLRPQLVVTYYLP